MMTELQVPDLVPRRQRIVLADDNRLLLEGLVNLLAAYGMDVVGTASDGNEAIELARHLCPDVILMDVRMPNCDGLEATRRIKASQPEIKIVMLTTSADDNDLFESVKSGAIGYLIKSISGPAFIEALRGLEKGVPPFSPGLAVHLLNEFKRMAEVEDSKKSPYPPDKQGDFSGSYQLTNRQTEVLRLVASGYTYKEIGKRLALSERTVRYHMANIMAALHMEYRSQVISYAGKLGLEDIEKKSL